MTTMTIRANFTLDVDDDDMARIANHGVAAWLEDCVQIDSDNCRVLYVGYNDES